MGSLVSILWTVAIILIVLWLLGFVFNLGGFASNGIIHILLIVAVVVIIYNLITSRRAA
jgi:small-conductance mechanosensitive channel